MASRRELLTRLLAGAATAAIPRMSWADLGAPAFVAAARERSGDYALCGLNADGGIAFRVPLPDRGHAAAAHPVRAEAVAFARRPGTFALVMDCATGTVRRRLHAPGERHFYGHGAYIEGGAVLATTENAFETGEGRIGLWDVEAGYARIGEVASGGIGPHEVVRLPGTDILAVANGGIRTHPDSDREKLNLPDMRPNLSYLTGDEVVETVELPPHLRQASIRHLSVRADGTVAMALQWEGPEKVVVPLLATHLRGAAPVLRAAPEADLLPLKGYGGSVAWSGDGMRVAVTGPKGGAAHIFPAGDGPPEILRRPDICGVAPAGDGLAFTDGNGGVLHPGGAVLHDVAWDNHLVALDRI